VNKTTVLVTGGTGFIGSRLVKELHRRGFLVTVLTRDRRRAIGLGCGVVEYNELDDMTPQNVVIHLATNYGREDGSVKDLVESNLFQPIRIFEKALTWKSSLIINTDTYYSKISGSHAFENYILSKKQLKEWLVMKFSKRIAVASMKLEHVFGPNDSGEKFCGKIIKSCLNNEAAISLSQCTQKRDFIFIDDVVSAYILILEVRGNLKGFNEFEVGTGVMHSLKDFAETCKQLSNSEVEFNYGAVKTQQNDLLNSAADNTPLSKLGWTPTYSMEQGLKKILT